MNPNKDKIRFRRQFFAVHVFILLSQIPQFFYLARVQEQNEYWLVSIVILVLILPFSWKNSWVEVDPTGIKVGNKMALKWNDIQSLSKKGIFYATFMTREGNVKRLNVFDWYRVDQRAFYAYVENLPHLSRRNV